MARELAGVSLFTNNKAKEIGGSALDDSTLKALYKFNTGALTTDSSGEGHTLTAISDPAEGTGVFGTCAVFDGNDAYSATDHADFKPTGNYSISAWIKVGDTSAAAQTYFQSFAYGSSDYAGFICYISTGGLVRHCMGKNTGNVLDTDYAYAEGTTVIDDDLWHHIVSTWDGSNIRIYVDGRLEDTQAWANANAYQATNYVRVGCQNNTGTNISFFTGSLDDLALWNGKVLTQDEVLDIYGRLTAYYRFSTGALTTDSSHWNTLTAIGNPVEQDGEFGKAALFGGLPTPTAWYKFSSGALTTDSSGSGYTLTAISDPAEDASGKFGGAVALDGNDAYSATDHADFKPTGSFSVSGWVKSTNTGVSQYIWQSFAVSTNNYGWRVVIGTTDKIAFYVSDGAGHDSSALVAIDVVDGNWHHFVGTFDGSYIRMYVDGQLGQETAYSYTPAYAATNYVRIGCRNTTGTNAAFYTGSIDDLVFFNGTALSQDQVTRLYNAEMAIGDAYSIVDSPALKPTGNFSVGGWVKSNGGTSDYIFQSKSQNTNVAGIYIATTSLGIPFIQSAKNTGTTNGVDLKSAVATTAVNDNAWHFVVGTWDGSYLDIYVDGVREDHEAWANAPAYAATNYVRVGCRNNVGTNANFWVGSLDDLFLFNGKALTETEIGQLFGTDRTHSVTDSMTSSDSINRGRFKTLSEALTAADLITYFKGIVKILTDTVNITESLLRAIQKQVVDTVSFAESLPRSLLRALTDSATYVEMTIKNTTRTLLSSVNISETLIRLQGKLFSDNITLTEVFTKLSSKFKTLVDSVSLTEILDRVFDKFGDTFNWIIGLFGDHNPRSTTQVDTPELDNDTNKPLMSSSNEKPDGFIVEQDRPSL